INESTASRRFGRSWRPGRLHAAAVASPGASPPPTHASSSADFTHRFRRTQALVGAVLLGEFTNHLDAMFGWLLRTFLTVVTLGSGKAKDAVYSMASRDNQSNFQGLSTATVIIYIIGLGFLVELRAGKLRELRGWRRVVITRVAPLMLAIALLLVEMQLLMLTEGNHVR